MDCGLVSIIVTVTITIIVTTIYLFFKHRFSYFHRKNIPYLRPSFPLGNINLSFYRKYGQELHKLYNAFKQQGASYGGFYVTTVPAILPIDPEFIKNILTKSFHNFHSRGMYCNEEKEFLSAHLASVNGTIWKNMRNKLTPTFSSSKLKHMFETILEKAEKLESALQKLSDTSTPFDIKDLCGKVTADMFCSVFLGIDCNSLENPDAEFPKYGKMLLDTNIVDSAKMTLVMTLPKLFEFFNLKVVRKDFSDFFVNAISEVVEYREKNSIERADFMNLLIRLKNKQNLDDGKTILDGEGITLKQLLAQCFVFFVGGYDTSATAMGFCMYEMTQNQDVQSKLREEINSVLKKYDGKVTYDNVMEMKFLDKVVAETLRKHPPVISLNRICVEDYQVPKTKVIIEKGTPVMVSILGLHHDPEHYPDPDKFDPERFSDEQKAKRHPYAYLPFGEGPRNCIAFRSGLLQIKLSIINFLKNYKFSLNPKTKLPVEFKTDLILLSYFNKIWIDTKKIKH